MRELKRKEAAGSPIRIDTESLGDFETLVSELIEEDEDIVMGLPEPTLDGEMPVPDYDLPPSIIDGTDDEEDEDEEDDVDEPEPIDGEQLLEDNRDSIESMCGGCIRFDTIEATGKGVRCSCLSEHFFLGMLGKRRCSLKKVN